MIRQIGPDDWSDWRDLCLQALAEDPVAFGAVLPADSEPAWRQQIAAGPCLIACAGDVPVGVAAANRVDDTCELTLMWVAPAARRQGLARQLVAAVVRWAAGREVSVWIAGTNSSAIAACESLGFVQHDEVDGDGRRHLVRPRLPYRLVQPPLDVDRPASGWGRRRRVGLRGVLGDLNRAGHHADVPAEAALYGMAWRRDDQNSARWFPQGITTSADAYGPEPSGGMFEGHNVIVTSWYAKGWLRRLLGSRLSVIDWRDEESPRYRHVLLVEPRRHLLGLPRLRRVRTHAGGIVWYGEHIFVAGSSQGIRVFRLDDVVRVRNRLRSSGYRYVLPQLTHYSAEHDGDGRAMTYSFMSLDRAGSQARPGTDDHLVAGEYGRKGASHRLMSYAIDPDTGLLRSDDLGRAVPSELHDRQVVRMQGAVVAEGQWVVTSSNGEGLAGDLWIGAPGAFTRHRGVLPTGAEDITYLPQRRQLWSLTEWPGRRWVYAIDADRWFPHGQ